MTNRGGPIGTIELSGRASQSLAITDELVKILVLVSDLGKHPFPEQPKELLQLYPFDT